jgi:hypothetical protein
VTTTEGTETATAPQPGIEAAEHPRTGAGAALVVVALITAVAALVILVNVFGTSNTRASVDGDAATTAVELDDE